MKIEDIIEDVLKEYEGSQINLDSPAARNLLAQHIASELETIDFWDNLDQGQNYRVDPLKDNDSYNVKSDCVHDDLSI